MDLLLKNKVVVVTGGTSGIGLATVRRLLEEGGKVAFCARTESKVQEISKLLVADFGECNVLGQAVDVLDKDAVIRFKDQVEREFGQCDGLITNAGQGRVSTFLETEDQDWRDELELKYFSQLNPINAFKPLLDRSEVGAIVAVNSLLAYQPEPHMVCTSSARAGVQNLLKSISVEFAPSIRVNSILIGLVESAQWMRRFDARDDKSISKEKWFEELAIKKGIPLKRLGKAQEAANTILFLVSPVSSYVTGAHIEVSGGLSRFI